MKNLFTIVIAIAASTGIQFYGHYIDAPMLGFFTGWVVTVIILVVYWESK